MGLFRAMNTGASGIYSSSVTLETIGDNIANLNTTAFKSTRANQETLFALTLREQGAAPGAENSVNPMQVGLGSNIGSISRNFAQGTTITTGVQTDLALDGKGFFMLQGPAGAPIYTRDGGFQLSVGQQLQNRDGLQVQGWQADDDGNVDPSGATGPLTIPLGIRTHVQATTSASLDGNLDATDVPASRGALQLSDALTTNTSGTPATAGTALTALVNEDGTAMYTAGDVIEVSNVAKGSGNILTRPSSFTVGTDGNTVQDLLTFLEGAVAIHTDATLPPNNTDDTGVSTPAGITLDSAGRIVVASNTGQINAVVFTSGNIVNTTTGRSVVTFNDPVQQAIGAGTTTDFQVFDSLGEQASLRLRLVPESQGELTSTWRWYAESVNDSDVSKALQSGVLTFDADGNLVGGDPAQVMINLADSGAADLDIMLDLAAITQLDGASSVLLNEQNGAPLGVLEDYGIDEDGVINGGFSNGVNLVLGQVAVATFLNPAGLELLDSSNYAESGASGAVTVTAAGTNGAGRVLSATLEQSNVELSREFIGLINTSTQFSASSRVISSADEMLQELLVALR